MKRLSISFSRTGEDSDTVTELRQLVLDVHGLDIDVEIKAKIIDALVSYSQFKMKMENTAKYILEDVFNYTFSKLYEEKRDDENT